MNSVRGAKVPVIWVRHQLDVGQQITVVTKLTPAATPTQVLLASLPAILFGRGETAVAEAYLAAVAALAHVVAGVAMVMGLWQATCRIRTPLCCRQCVGGGCTETR